MEKLYQEWQHQKSKMLLRVFNSCAAKGTTSISESIFAFVNASKVCKISRDLLKIVSQAIKNQVWKHWREIRIPAYTDGKPVTCSSPPPEWKKKLKCTEVRSYSDVCIWRCLELTEFTNEKSVFGTLQAVRVKTVGRINSEQTKPKASENACVKFSRKLTQWKFL